MNRARQASERRKEAKSPSAEPTLADTRKAGRTLRRLADKSPQEVVVAADAMVKRYQAIIERQKANATRLLDTLRRCQDACSCGAVERVLNSSPAPLPSQGAVHVNPTEGVWEPTRPDGSPNNDGTL